MKCSAQCQARIWQALSRHSSPASRRLKAEAVVGSLLWSSACAWQHSAPTTLVLQPVADEGASHQLLRHPST
eukprot:502651-Rhodomonas_salina.3